MKRLPRLPVEELFLGVRAPRVEQGHFFVSRGRRSEPPPRILGRRVRLWTPDIREKSLAADAWWVDFEVARVYSGTAAVGEGAALLR